MHLPTAPAMFALLGASLLSACTHLSPEVITFDGRAVEVVTAGEGEATVVFESGLGADWKHWDKVANAVAPHARVFAYSRPGYGDSDPITTPRDPATIVEELHELLASQGYAPPYVVVGHSTGGAYMELFAKSHPEEVAAAVLVDPRPGGWLTECEAQELDACGPPQVYLDTAPDPIRPEYDAFALASEEISAAGPFGAYPVRVLTATRNRGASDEQIALWESMTGSIADEANDGEQILLDGSHNLHVFHWEEVAETIIGVLP